MAQSEALSKAQFSRTSASGDPSNQYANRKPQFTGSTGSKTMTVAGGKLPPKPTTHPHHRKASKRTYRAR